MNGDLPAGVYEQLLTAALADRLQAELSELADLHPAEAADRRRRAPEAVFHHGPVEDAQAAAAAVANREKMPQRRPALVGRRIIVADHRQFAAAADSAGDDTFIRLDQAVDYRQPRAGLGVAHDDGRMVVPDVLQRVDLVAEVQRHVGLLHA